MSSSGLRSRTAFSLKLKDQKLAVLKIDLNYGSKENNSVSKNFKGNNIDIYKLLSETFL